MKANLKIAALVSVLLLAAIPLFSADPASQPGGAPTAASTQPAAAEVTAVLGAFGPEVAQIQRRMTDTQTQSLHGLRVVTGKIGRRSVVLAQTGIGKVNAAMTTSLVIERFSPSQIIFSGIAGGVSDRVRPGDIVIAEKIAQHDFGDVTDAGMKARPLEDPISGEKHPMFHFGDPRLIELARSSARTAKLTTVPTSIGQRPPEVMTGTVVTGDVFVASAAKKQQLIADFGADAVEMEGAAVAQVAAQLKVPCVVIRSISDMADKAAFVDIGKFLEVAAGNSASLVCEMVRQLGEGAAASASTSSPASAPASVTASAPADHATWTTGGDPRSSVSYPPNGGFAGKPVTATLAPGIMIDRYGTDAGRFVSPLGTPLATRSLPPGDANGPHNTFRVLKPIAVQSGPAAPWFGQPGGGTQYELPQSISSLLESAQLERVAP